MDDSLLKRVNSVVAAIGERTYTVTFLNSCINDGNKRYWDKFTEDDTVNLRVIVKTVPKMNTVQWFLDVGGDRLTCKEPPATIADGELWEMVNPNVLGGRTVFKKSDGTGVSFQKQVPYTVEHTISREEGVDCQWPELLGKVTVSVDFEGDDSERWSFTSNGKLFTSYEHPLYAKNLLDWKVCKVYATAAYKYVELGLSSYSNTKRATYFTDL
jgi:hypothetical protein